MTIMAKKELISEVKARYIKSGKSEKTKILDEFCQNTGYHRKYATAILQAGYDYRRVKREGRKPRKKIYGNKAISAIIKIWELLDYPCGVRLQPVLATTAESLIRNKELIADDELMAKLRKIGAATIDRRLNKERGVRKLAKNRGATRHGTLLKSSVPIKITDWDTSEVGFMEMDTVAHNGGDPSGEFIYSLDLVEIFSGWTEQRAIMGKGKTGVIEQINDVKKSAPFILKGLDSDSGSEFVNWHMVDYCKGQNIFFTRSRPDRKNDNAYVEQKNYTHIRKQLGYRRYDNQEQLSLINDLYKNELSLFNNFFRPVMKIKTKEKINNSVCKKKYDLAQTPYQRLIGSNQISEQKKKELIALYLSLNPVQLKKAIKEKIKKIKYS